MYTIHKTDAFVLRNQTFGEANAYLDLFTRELGLIRASAQGVRHLKSKLRYSLTDFSYSSVSVVRGKEIWRLTNAIKKNDAMADIPESQAKESLLRIFSLLRRLLIGEEKHVELFDLVDHLFSTLISNSFALQSLSSMEEIAVLRILFLLGYINQNSNLSPFLQDKDYSEALLEQALNARKDIVNEINKALKASEL